MSRGPGCRRHVLLPGEARELGAWQPTPLGALGLSRGLVGPRADGAGEVAIVNVWAIVLLYCREFHRLDYMQLILCIGPSSPHREQGQHTTHSKATS